jgi:hypothetical protein
VGEPEADTGAPPWARAHAWPAERPGARAPGCSEPAADLSAHPADLAPGRVSLPRWVGPLFLTAAGCLVPWVVFLAMALPRRAVTVNYRLAWVGFDLALAAVLSALGWLAYKRSTWTELLAMCAATLLVVDAWFDIVTASETPVRVLAIGLAAVFELPFAALCLWLARNAERVRRQGIRTLRWRVAELESRLPHRRRSES